MEYHTNDLKKKQQISTYPEIVDINVFKTPVTIPNQLLPLPNRRQIELNLPILAQRRESYQKHSETLI
jgi:hypothetical protein